MRTFHITTWGCQMNYTDTEKMAYLLEKAGLQQALSMSTADLIILNTCSVRQRAEDKVLGLSRAVRKIKEARPDVHVVLTGCMSQRIRRECNDFATDQNHYRWVQETMPWVDSVIGIGDYSQLTTCASSEKIPTQAYLDVPQKYSSRISAYVPISQGCDNFCTYCVVPFSRGKEVHRPAVDIRRQVETLVGADCKLITLLGQNVTSWKGRVENREASFPALLRYITAVNGKYWLTYLTAHPKDVTMKLLDVLVDCGDKVCSYINLPMQSGSPAVLARMNRGYTVDEYVRKVEMLRAAVPDMRVSTDIIVGFPGETEEEFEETYNLMQDIQFSMAYVAEYSSRKGAASSLLEDSVPVKVKKERKMRIENLQRSIIEKKNAQSVGSHADVLVKTSNSGVTHDLREVRFEKDVSESIGNIVQSLVVGSSASGLLCRTPV